MSKHPRSKEKGNKVALLGIVSHIQNFTLTLKDNCEILNVQTISCG